MTLVFCPYAGKAVEIGSCSDEHIIPESIGGCRGFAIPVSRQLNSDLGTEVDGPFVNSSMMRFFRQKHGIKSKSGVVPPFEQQARLHLPHGSPVDVTIERRGQSAIVRPKTVAWRSGTGWLRLVLGADADAVAKHRAKATRSKRKGRAPERVTKTTHGQAHVTLGSEITFGIDHEVAMRFFAKVALASSFAVLGPDWGAGQLASTLRRIMLGREDWAAEKTKGVFLHRPHGHRQDGQPPKIFSHTLDTTADEHEVIFAECEGATHIWMTIFGIIGARYRVLDPGSDGRSGGFGIDFKTRTARMLAVKRA